MSALIRFSDMFYLVIPKHLFYSPYMPPPTPRISASPPGYQPPLFISPPKTAYEVM